MNVYQDQASNPCGDCPDQPVSIYVGTGTAETVEAMAEAVRRADDIWEVTETTDSSLTLKEKTPGSVTEEPELSAPEGLTLTGSFSAEAEAESTDGAESETGLSGGGMKTITNLDGEELQVPEEAPERIAAIYGPAYEALTVLGAEDRIVVCADVQFENFPWARKCIRGFQISLI